MQVCVAQIGARRHYAVPVALHRSGMLNSLHTDWCTNRGLPRLVEAMTPGAARTGSLRRLSDRRVPEVPRQKIHTHMQYAWSMRRKRNRSNSNYEYWENANRAFGESVVKVGFRDADVVYGFNAAAVEILHQARRCGLRTALDQTMAPWQTVETLLAEERERWPDWEDTGAANGWQGLAEREFLEWESADVIICGSSYVVDALAQIGGPTDRCRVVPYGYDVSSAAVPRDLPGRPAGHRALRVLFVGTVDLRKGIPYLIQAAELLSSTDVEFRIVGPIGVSDSAISRMRKVADVRGPVPRSQVCEHYQWADVFVLPTLAEGSANVCYEAMAHGLPVIATPNAGSVVRDGRDGWIIPAQSPEAISDRIEFLAANRQDLAAASSSARSWAATFTWNRYGEQLVHAIRDQSSSADVLPTHLSAT